MLHAFSEKPEEFRLSEVLEYHRRLAAFGQSYHQVEIGLTELSKLEEVPVLQQQLVHQHGTDHVNSVRQVDLPESEIVSELQRCLFQFFAADFLDFVAGGLLHNF